MASVDLPACRDGASEEQEAPMCRYCFEGEESGQLISPCKCMGGQKWVHLSCLRRWQRGVLVSQPTHPDFYDSDTRHITCNVCNSAYTCKPPTRLELMQSFTGAELAAAVEVGSLIGSSRSFGGELKRQLQGIPEHLHVGVADRHWIDGVFLIVQVTKDATGIINLKLSDSGDASAFAEDLSDDWCWQSRGRTYRLEFQGPLQGASSGDRNARISAIKELDVPCYLKLVSIEEADGGQDGIVAVNLTQPFRNLSSGPEHARKKWRFQQALKQALAAGETLHEDVEVLHFIGGPCHEELAHAAIVSTDAERYDIHEELHSALAAAQSTCQEWARDCEPSRKRARTSSNDTIPENTSASAPCGANTASSSAEVCATEQPRKVIVKVFWGTAGWSRSQLLGEIASGSWGLCKSSSADVTSTAARELYESVYPRLVFAPTSEMSESYDRVIPDHTADVNQEHLVQLHRRLQRRRRAAEIITRVEEATATDDERLRVMEFLEEPLDDLLESDSLPSDNHSEGGEEEDAAEDEVLEQP